MKNIFTLLFTVILSGAVFAQEFNSYPKNQTVTGPASEFELVGHAFIKNISGDTTFTWKRITNDLPANWSAAICDNQTCWDVIVNRNTIFIPVGDSSILDLHFYPQNTAGTGFNRLLVWRGNDSLNADTVEYTADTWGNSARLIRGSNKDLTVYPNPANKELSLRFEASTTASVEIFDVLGKKMKSYTHSGNTSTADISDLRPGLYLVKVTEGNKTYSRTFKKTN